MWAESFDVAVDASDEVTIIHQNTWTFQRVPKFNIPYDFIGTPWKVLVEYSILLTTSFWGQDSQADAASNIYLLPAFWFKLTTFMWLLLQEKLYSNLPEHLA